MKNKKHLKKRRLQVHHHRKRSGLGALFGFNFNRIIIIGICIVLLMSVFIIANKRTVAREVAGISIMKGLWNEATIQLPQINGVNSYNVYYKAVSDPTFIHAARNIPATSTYYTLSYLRKGTLYEYRVSAVDNTGTEIWFSDIKQVTNTQSM